MSKKAVYHYLEQPGLPSREADDAGLLALLQEVEALPEQDPGEAYWQHFEARLGKRISQPKVAAPRRIPWLTLLGFGLSCLFLSLLLPPNATKVKPKVTPATTISMELSQLNDEQLQMIAQIYTVDDDGESLEYGAYADELMGIYGEELVDETRLPDADTLKNLINEEG